MVTETQLQHNSNSKPGIHDIKTFTFKKEEGRWFIYLPEYLEHGWTKKDLEMVEGAHKLLNTIASGAPKVTLRLSTEPFDGADVLELMEHCPAPKGGAIYLLETCHGREISSFIWICDIALFVFGDLPEHIYVQRVRKARKGEEADV
jgi:hypothetical protein